MNIRFFLDSLQVKTHWLAGYPVNWYTGDIEAGNRPISSHCSTFVASAVSRLGGCILHPPILDQKVPCNETHSAVLLANAQQDWLLTKGFSYGWKQIKYSQIKSYSDNYLIIASLKRKNGPGHIAIVYPTDDKNVYITSVGRKNYNAIDINLIFKNITRVKFFAIAI